MDFRFVHVNSTTVALMMVLVVLAVATRWGLPESMGASLAGMLCLNYFFLPPVGKWTIADPQNWVALCVFVITAVVASQLSARAKRRTAEANSRRREMERLYVLSRSLMRMDTESPFARQIASRIAEVFALDRVVFYDRDDDAVYGPESMDMAPMEGPLRELATGGTSTVINECGVTVSPVNLGSVVIGSLALPTESMSGSARRAVTQLAAIALDRARGQEAASRAEATRLSEELKSTMLDALAHELKTPLTSIKAAVTAVLGCNSSVPTQTELLQVIDEETDRVTSMVTEAIQVARIEAGQIELRKAPHSMAALVRQVLALFSGCLESRTVEVQVSESLPPVEADAELVRIVIRQLVDNAAKYSPPASPISIRATQRGESIVLSVADRGPGISGPDRERIFERFYRGHAGRGPVSGTGMGLAIAREIIRAHNGEIGVESQLGRGSEFHFSLPVARAEAQP